MKRGPAILLSVVLAGVAFYEFGIVAICDGWYDLTVEIDGDSAANVSRVSYLPVNSRDTVNSFVAMLDDLSYSVEHQSSAEPFTVNVGFSYHASNLLGRTWGHVQEYSHIIVVLHHVDGSQVVHILAVPQRDDSRRITVTAASAI